MNALRILMVTNNYTPYSGGVVSSIDTCAQQLAHFGHEVIICTLDFLGVAHIDPAHVKRVPCPIKFMYKNNHMAVPWSASKYLHALIRTYRPDIIHSHHPSLLGASALNIARLHNIPIIFTHHTMYELYAHYLPLPKIVARAVIRQTVQGYCQSVDGIIVPSAPIEKHLILGGITTPITIAPTGLHSLFLAPMRMRSNDTGEPLRLLYVGRFAREKNIVALLDVVAQLYKQGVNFTCTLIGYGAEYEALHTYIYQHHGVPTDRVTFMLQPEKTVIAEQYRTADVFLFTSHTDTQGLVLAEAMAGGALVVALPGPGQEAIVKNGYNGFVVPDTGQMVATLCMIAHNNELRTTLQQQAWETGQLYGPQVCTQRLVDFYGKFV